MKEISFINGELILKIDGIKQPLTFTLGVLVNCEREFGSLTEGLRNIGSIKGSIYYATEIINAAIRKYNREYNGNEKPTNTNEICNIINELGCLSDLSFFIYNVYLKSQPVATSSSGDLNNKEPSTAGFIVMGVAKLGFSKAEIMEMTVRELSEYINFYMDSIGAKKGTEVKVPKGVTVQGIGKAEDILRLLR